MNKAKEEENRTEGKTGVEDTSDDSCIGKLGNDPFPIIFVDAKQAPYIQKRIAQQNQQAILDFIQATAP